MTHTVDSLMALADEYARLLSTTGHLDGRASLRLAIREVLAERDELKHRLEHENAESMRVYNEMGLRIDLERAEAEVERLRKDAERYRWLAARWDGETSPEFDSAIDAAMKEIK